MNTEYAAPTREEEFYRETHTCFECGEVSEDVMYSEQFDKLLCPECEQVLGERRIEGVMMRMEDNP